MGWWRLGLVFGWRVVVWSAVVVGLLAGWLVVWRVVVDLRPAGGLPPLLVPLPTLRLMLPLVMLPLLVPLPTPLLVLPLVVLPGPLLALPTSLVLVLPLLVLLLLVLLPTSLLLVLLPPSLLVVLLLVLLPRSLLVVLVLVVVVVGCWRVWWGWLTSWWRGWVGWVVMVGWWWSWFVSCIGWRRWCRWRSRSSIVGGGGLTMGHGRRVRGWLVRVGFLAARRNIGCIWGRWRARCRLLVGVGLPVRWEVGRWRCWGRWPLLEPGSVSWVTRRCWSNMVRRW